MSEIYFCSIEKLKNKMIKALENAEKYKLDTMKYNAFIKYADNLKNAINSFNFSENNYNENIEERISSKFKSYKISISYTDKYCSKYRYGNLYPIGINMGNIICNFLTSDKWEKQIEINITAPMNDNRLDRYYGFDAIYEHIETKKIIKVFCEVSATGKTKEYTFSSPDVDNIEELNILLNLK